ncbi:DNA methyltransferase [Corynebacterium striatum]|uniref:DNA methyltransferase n=1 Tax=Corynebacterium striatum TaxID=43770 RepID=UPI003F81A21B
MSSDSMTLRRSQAEKFAERWKERGQEKSDSQSFWTDLLRSVFHHDNPETTALFEQGTEYGGWIDAVIPSARTFVEMKSRGKSLDARQNHRGSEVTPFEQAYTYVSEVPGHKRPRYIITSNFEVMRVYDLDEPRASENYQEFKVDDLADNLSALMFLDANTAELTRYETQVSWTAGETIGKLYSLLRKQYSNPNSPESLHELNVLLVRLVFCLFAEDALVFHKNSFYSFLKDKSPADARFGLMRLFRALDTPVAERDEYDTELSGFPYVNGGLFRDEVTIPQLTEEILEVLIVESSGQTDWSKISPTIFGGVFESTLNPDTRKSGGMHYTSPENIHRVIDPLFFDDLEQELEDIVNMQGQYAGKGARAQKNAFERFHDKLASLTFFDPACGSGNFLTETYLSLRRLENIVLTHLYHNQYVMGFEDVNASPVKVSLRQFHGIEINDFAVAVAQTALWIAELQTNQETSIIVKRNIDDLPLRDSADIHLGSALEIPWESVIPAEDCSYIIGNPPFIIGDSLTGAQKKDRTRIFGKNGSKLDYVACWFLLAAQYTKGTKCEVAFVSTSSICQGQQAPALWQPMYNSGIKINFAHRAFTWANETRNVASVHVVIIGFAHKQRSERVLYIHDRNDKETEIKTVSNINPYLLDAPDVFIQATRKSPKDMPRMSKGFQPTDNGNLLIDAGTYDAELARDPGLEPFIRRFTQAKQFINGTRAYIIWVHNNDLPDVAAHRFLRERIEKNEEWRSEQSESGDAFKLKDSAHRPREASAFVDSSDYILIPRHTSHLRKYIPIDLIKNSSMIPGDAVSFIPSDDRYVLGLLISRMCTLWLDIAGGRIRQDYRFGSDTVYNTMPLPIADTTTRDEIASLAQRVLDERAKLAQRGKTLEAMYKPGDSRYYPDLFEAHVALDTAVATAYGTSNDLDDSELQLFLFNKYLEAHPIKVTGRKKK